MTVLRLQFIVGAKKNKLFSPMNQTRFETSSNVTYANDSICSRMSIFTCVLTYCF